MVLCLCVNHHDGGIPAYHLGYAPAHDLTLHTTINGIKWTDALNCFKGNPF